MKKIKFISLVFLLLFTLASCNKTYYYIMPEDMKSVIEEYNDTYKEEVAVTAKEGILIGPYADVFIEFNEKANKTADDKMNFLLYFHNNYEFKKHIVNHDDGGITTIKTLSVSFGDIELKYDVSGYVDGVPYDEVYKEPRIKIITKEVFDFSIVEQFGENIILELIPEGELTEESYRQELAEKYKDYNFKIVS